MATRKQQLQRVVLINDLQWRFGLLRGNQLALLAGAVAPSRVDEAPKCRLGEPAARIGGYAVARPMQRGGEQGFLDSVLRRVEVACGPNERAQHLRRKLAQQILNVRLFSG